MFLTTPTLNPARLHPYSFQLFIPSAYPYCESPGFKDLLNLSSTARVVSGDSSLGIHVSWKVPGSLDGPRDWEASPGLSPC